MSLGGVCDTQRPRGGLTAPAARLLWWTLGCAAGLLLLWFAAGMLTPSTVSAAAPASLSRERTPDTRVSGDPTSKGRGHAGRDSGDSFRDNAGRTPRTTGLSRELANGDLALATSDDRVVTITPPVPPADATVTAQPELDRFLITARNADAPTSYEFRLGLPEGYGAELAGDGSVQVTNQTGELVQRIDVPWARDANGRELPTEFALRGGTLIQHVGFDRHSAFPVTADPAGAPLLTGAPKAVAKDADSGAKADSPKPKDGHPTTRGGGDTKPKDGPKNGDGGKTKADTPKNDAPKHSDGHPTTRDGGDGGKTGDTKSDEAKTSDHKSGETKTSDHKTDSDHEPDGTRTGGNGDDSQDSGRRAPPQFRPNLAQAPTRDESPSRADTRSPHSDTTSVGGSGGSAGGQARQTRIPGPKESRLYKEVKKGYEAAKEWFTEDEPKKDTEEPQREPPSSGPEPSATSAGRAATADSSPGRDQRNEPAQRAVVGGEPRSPRAVPADHSTRPSTSNPDDPETADPSHSGTAGATTSATEKQDDRVGSVVGQVGAGGDSRGPPTGPEEHKQSDPQIGSGPRPGATPALDQAAEFRPSGTKADELGFPGTDVGGRGDGASGRTPAARPSPGGDSPPRLQGGSTVVTDIPAVSGGGSGDRLHAPTAVDPEPEQPPPPIPPDAPPGDNGDAAVVDPQSGNDRWATFSAPRAHAYVASQGDDAYTAAQRGNPDDTAATRKAAEDRARLALAGKSVSGEPGTAAAGGGSFDIDGYQGWGGVVVDDDGTTTTGGCSGPGSSCGERTVKDPDTGEVTVTTGAAEGTPPTTTATLYGPNGGTCSGVSCSRHANDQTGLSSGNYTRDGQLLNADGSGVATNNGGSSDRAVTTHPPSSPAMGPARSPTSTAASPPSRAAEPTVWRARAS